MIRWLTALVASSFTFALADVLCDICSTLAACGTLPLHLFPSEPRIPAPSIACSAKPAGLQIAACHDLSLPACCLCGSAVTEADEDERARNVETAADDDESADGIEMTPVGERYDEEERPNTPRYKQLSDPKGPDGELHPDQHEHGEGLSGAQDAAIAGIVTIIGLLVSILYWLLFGGSSVPGGAGSSISLHWRPGTHLQWWFAMLGGAMAFLHYFFLLKAFEGAPSTVLLPLVQVRSHSHAAAAHGNFDVCCPLPCRSAGGFGVCAFRLLTARDLAA